jgi:hypothetical protein
MLMKPFEKLNKSIMWIGGLEVLFMVGGVM